MAELREVPFAQYYGSVDATPLFVLLAGLYVERTGDDETLAELWPSIEAALGWIDGAGDPDRDGFVEYRRASEQGLANQGWKDSYDAIFHADGRLAEGYIALAEVQGYVYAGKRLAARCARAAWHDRRGARSSRPRREQLAERFEEAFWCDELGTYALALDGAKQPCRVRTSNAGQLLFTGIVRADRARLVAADLMRPHFFTGWGIRTVARGEARYNPMSYHNGSIWPHDNALIALGLARYGLKHSVAQVFKALFDAATYMDLRRLARVVLRLPAREADAGRRSIRSPARRRPGRARRRSRCWRPRSGSNSTPSAVKSGCAIRVCRRSSTRWCCANCNWDLQASTSGSAAMATRCRWRSCARAAGSRCRSCWRIEGGADSRKEAACAQGRLFDHSRPCHAGSPARLRHRGRRMMSRRRPNVPPPSPTNQPPRRRRNRRRRPRSPSSAQRRRMACSAAMSAARRMRTWGTSST